jgi:hypothetical protein
MTPKLVYFLNSSTSSITSFNPLVCFEQIFSHISVIDFKKDSSLLIRVRGTMDNGVSVSVHLECKCCIIPWRCWNMLSRGFILFPTKYLNLLLFNHIILYLSEFTILLLKGLTMNVSSKIIATTYIIDAVIEENVSKSLHTK